MSGTWRRSFITFTIPIALQGDGTPNGYYIMSMRGTEVAMRYKAASLPADHQMRITVAPVFEHASLGPAAPQNYNEAQRG